MEAFPAEVLARALRGLPPRARARARLVCARWRAAVDDSWRACDVDRVWRTAKRSILSLAARGDLPALRYALTRLPLKRGVVRAWGTFERACESGDVECVKWLAAALQIRRHHLSEWGAALKAREAGRASVVEWLASAEAHEVFAGAAQLTSGS